MTLDITLGVTIEETQVTVGEEAAINTDPETNASAIVLKESDVEALPDNPDELEAALRALAGPSAGPNGGEKKGASNQGQDGGQRGGINSPFGGGGGQRGGRDEDESKYKLEFSAQIRNLLNRTNGGTPVGNLRSEFFGQPVSLAGGFGFGGGGSQSAGNRRIEFEIQFSF